MRPRVQVVVLVAAFLVGATAGALSDSTPEDARGKPAAGRFLVASAGIRGSIFHESVVYLVSYSESGAVGLIVNRPTDVGLHEIVQGAADGSGTLFVGGPVDSSSVMMLLRAEAPPERATRVAEDVFVSADAAMLLEHTSSAADGALRVYAGHAGWGPRQLDGEIARGYWLVVSAPTDAIFAKQPETLWEKLFRQHHRVLTRTPSPPPFRS